MNTSNRPSPSSTTVSRSEVRNLITSMSGRGFGKRNERFLLWSHRLGVAQQLVKPVTATARDDGADQSLVRVCHIYQLGFGIGRVKRRHQPGHPRFVHFSQANLPAPTVDVGQGAAGVARKHTDRDLRP